MTCGAFRGFTTSVSSLQSEVLLYRQGALIPDSYPSFESTVCSDVFNFAEWVGLEHALPGSQLDRQIKHPGAPNRTV